MDSWYTARWFCHQLTKKNVPWIGEASSRQKFQVGQYYLSVPEIHRYFRRRLKRIRLTKKGVRAVSLQATIRPDLYTKKTQKVRLALVTGLAKERDNDKGYKLLVCNQTKWSTKRIVRLFSYRPKIEGVHRQGKQDEGWNDFQTRKIEALHAHVSFSLLRSTLLYLMRVWEPKLIHYSFREMIDHWINYFALMTVTNSGQLLVHFEPNYPALSLLEA